MSAYLNQNLSFSIVTASQLYSYTVSLLCPHHYHVLSYFLPSPLGIDAVLMVLSAQMRLQEFVCDRFCISEKKSWIQIFRACTTLGNMFTVVRYFFFSLIFTNQWSFSAAGLKQLTDCSSRIHIIKLIKLFFFFFKWMHAWECSANQKAFG